MPYWYIEIKVIVFAAITSKLTNIAFSSFSLYHSYLNTTLNWTFLEYLSTFILGISLRPITSQAAVKIASKPVASKIKLTL